MKRSITLVIVVLAWLAGGCSSDEGSEPRRTTTTESESPPTTEGEPATTTTTKPVAKPSAVFGQPLTWNDGLQITVSPPERFDPDGATSGEGSPSYVKVVVRIANGSQADYQPLLSITASERGATDATKVLLTDAGAAGFPAANIPPGDEVAFSIGFEITIPTGLILQVAPGVGYPPATFAAA